MDATPSVTPSVSLYNRDAIRNPWRAATSSAPSAARGRSQGPAQNPQRIHRQRTDQPAMLANKQQK